MALSQFVFFLCLFFFVGPRARTQVCPTIKNFTPRHPAQAWETRKVQPSKCNEGLASGALPSWSQLLQCIVSMTDQAKSRFYTNPLFRSYCFIRQLDDVKFIIQVKTHSIWSFVLSTNLNSCTSFESQLLVDGCLLSRFLPLFLLKLKWSHSWYSKAIWERFFLSNKCRTILGYIEKKFARLVPSWTLILR